MPNGQIEMVRDDGVVAQARIEPSDIDGSVLALPIWPKIGRAQAISISEQLERLLTSRQSMGMVTAGSDGQHHRDYYQFFYPRVLALRRHLQEITASPRRSAIQDPPAPTMPYFWQEVDRIFASWGTKRPFNFNLLTRLEGRLMDLAEETHAGDYHQPLPMEGAGLIGLADLIGNVVSL